MPNPRQPSPAAELPRLEPPAPTAVTQSLDTPVGPNLYTPSNVKDAEPAPQTPPAHGLYVESFGAARGDLSMDDDTQTFAQATQDDPLSMSRSFSQRQKE